MRVIVSLTTIPSRIGLIKPMIESVLEQTYKPDRFVLWIPSRCLKENSQYVIPPWLSELSVEIGDTVCDYGPATKLIPSLQQEEEPNTRIITLDDDVAYEKHALEEMVQVSETWSDMVFGFMGCRAGPTYIHAEHLDPAVSWTEVEVLGGYRGIIYRRGLLDSSIMRDLLTLLEQGPFVCDDQLFSWNLLRRGIKRAVLRTKYPGPKNSLNFRFLGLGGGIYDGEHKLAEESIKHLEELYDRNGWRHS